MQKMDLAPLQQPCPLSLPFVPGHLLALQASGRHPAPNASEERFTVGSNLFVSCSSERSHCLVMFMHLICQGLWSPPFPPLLTMSPFQRMPQCFYLRPPPRCWAVPAPSLLISRPCILAGAHWPHGPGAVPPWCRKGFNSPC